MDLEKSCELLSDFVYSFFEHNTIAYLGGVGYVVNCFQILYIRSLNTTRKTYQIISSNVVNCFQILYIRSLNTTKKMRMAHFSRL